MRLQDKVAFITGAGSGLGAEYARRFKAEGAKLILTDLNETNVRGVAEPLGAFWMKHDVTSEEQWAAAMVFATERYGTLNVLVNNAGLSFGGSIENTTLQDWRRTHAVNNDGTFLGCRSAVGLMKATGGSIINISSASAIAAQPHLCAYGSSKGAVRVLTKSVALYCASRGYPIRCNSVHPSYVDTPMIREAIKKSPDPEAKERQIKASTPMGRLPTLAEISAAVVFLASDESSFMTGAEMVVDGGMTAA